MAQIGDKVKGNWGAMHPTSRGEVIGLCFKRGVLVRWDEAYPSDESWHVLRDPASPSPIGVTLVREG